MSADVPVPQADAGSTRGQGITLLALPQPCFCGLQLCNIADGSDEAQGSTLFVESRLGTFVNSADLAIRPNDPVLDLEWPSSPKRSGIGRGNSVAIVGVDALEI